MLVYPCYVALTFTTIRSYSQRLVAFDHQPMRTLAPTFHHIVIAPVLLHLFVCRCCNAQQLETVSNE